MRTCVKRAPSLTNTRLSSLGGFFFFYWRGYFGEKTKFISRLLKSTCPDDVCVQQSVPKSNFGRQVSLSIRETQQGQI